MLWQYQGQNLFKTKTSSDILPWVSTDTAEYYFDIVEWVNAQSCFVYLDYQDLTNRETIEIHRTENNGTRLYFYQYRREYPNKTHEQPAFCQINTTAQYINTLMDNVDTFWRTRKMMNPWNKVRIYWGKAEDLASQYINVWDKEITCSDWDNYIYYDHINNEFTKSATIPTEFDLMSKVVVVSWNITSVVDMRAFKVRLKNGTVLKELTDVWGNLVYKGTPLWGGSGTGDVIWPSSAIDWHLAVFDWPTGKIIKAWWLPVIYDSVLSIVAWTVYTAPATGWMLIFSANGNGSSSTESYIYSDTTEIPTTLVAYSRVNGWVTWNVPCITIPILPWYNYKFASNVSGWNHIAKFYYKS